MLSAYGKPIMLKDRSYYAESFQSSRKRGLTQWMCGDGFITEEMDLQAQAAQDYASQYFECVFRGLEEGIDDNPIGFDIMFGSAKIDVKHLGMMNSKQPRIFGNVLVNPGDLEKYKRKNIKPPEIYLSVRGSLETEFVMLGFIPSIELIQEYNLRTFIQRRGPCYACIAESPPLYPVIRLWEWYSKTYNWRLYA